MVPDERPERPDSCEDRAAPPDSEGCPLPTGHLQSCRARIHQLITRELRIRTGAENLYRAASSARVRETVALELGRINARLQLLREELDELHGDSGDGHPHAGTTVSLIPLGLKETRDLQWAPALKELISEHFGEDGTSYEAEIQELEGLRQAIRTPSRSEAGLEVLTAYYTQLGFLDARFAAPTGGLNLLFHWYDCITGVPAQQRALAFEKGSVLFNIGALHTQIGVSQDHTCPTGTTRAMDAFQRAAGAFRLLRESFSNAPSPDMSPPWLLALEQLMMAQAQECVFQGLSLQPPAPQDCRAQLRLAQEAAQVAAEYRLVHGTVTQPALRDLVPLAWAALVRVKAEHFQALAHYHVALGLCDGLEVAEEDLERVFLTPRVPALSLEPEQRRKLGKAHLRRALLGQERALQLHARGRALRSLDLLQAALGQVLQRSLAKYTELDQEDDFCEAADAPHIRPETQQRPEPRTPGVSGAQAADIFHRLGPLPVFSARNRWRLVGPVHMAPGEGGFGFTLRGDAPVLIAAVVPGSQAAAAGLKRGDYVVSVGGQPCRWWRRAEVVAQLRGAGTDGVSLQVASPLTGPEPPAMGTF